MNKPVTAVIFGGSSDLTNRKLIPAFFNLFRKERLPSVFKVVGFSTTPMSDVDYRAKLHNGVKEHSTYPFSEEEWLRFAENIHYFAGSALEPKDFQKLSTVLVDLEKGEVDRLYYLATPPALFSPIINNLGAAGLAIEREGWRRVVIEKPFGTDLLSAGELNTEIHKVLKEDQIYRIDHYLGKETVQNLLVFRFANTIFEPLWNRNYIDHIQITVAESVGIEHRGGYYDQVGAIRDMFQNHLLQLLTLVAMEPPSSFKADPLRDERVKVLKAVKPMTRDDVMQHVIRGQYRGYREEVKVDPQSHTETYAAMRLFIENWRWQGVPFYLRSGKCLPAKSSEIIIQFKCPPMNMFKLPADYEISSNVLGICLQPNEGIHLRFEAKVPDTLADLRTVDMDFHYRESFGETKIPDAYERLLLDALQGDASLFTRADQTEESWKIIDPIIEGLHSPQSPVLLEYEPGTWGPLEADAFMTKDGRSWYHFCG